MNPIRIKTWFSFTILALFLVACSEKAEKKTSWEDVKSNAKAAYTSAIELSKDKWNELKSITSDEWQETGKSITELKNKVVESGSSAKPKLDKLMSEMETLQEQADQKLREFSQASGDKVDASKAKLEETWKQLKAKIEEVQQELKAQ